MIVFDLGCDRGHVFEAWFGSSEDYENQRARGLVTCPICDSRTVDKAVMAPRVGRKGNQVAAVAPAPETASTAPPPEPGQIRAMLETLAKAQKEALKDSQWVGSRFADEARAIHLGEADARSIHGQATMDEAKALIEEGVAVAPLPFPVRPPGGDN